MEAPDSRVALREILRLLWNAATPYVKARLASVVALVLAAAMLSAIGPAVLRLIVNALAGKGSGRPISVSVLVTVYASAFGLARALNEVRELVFARVRERITRTLSERLFSHLMHLPLRFHLDRQTGALSGTLESGLEGLRLILHHLVFTYLPVTVELSAVSLILFHLVRIEFLVLFAGAVLCYVTAFGYSAAIITKSAHRASAARIDAAAVMTDSLLNYEAVKHFTAEGLVQDRVSRELVRAESAWVGFHRQYAVNGLLVAGVLAAFLAGIGFCAAGEVRSGRMTLGDFVLVNTYVLQIVQPLEMLGYASQGLSHGLAMLDRLVRVFRVVPEAQSHEGKRPVAGPGCLDFRGVSLSYRAERQVLNEVTFRVAAGKTLGVVGASGSGKSTLVRLIMRLLEPDSGTILLDGVSIRGMSLRELRRSIAVVPQDAVLFDDTVRYNIAFGRTGASADEIEKAARIAQLHELVMSFPDGYDTLVGERGLKLSGGERQRISIARAVLKSPRIYVFDEATSALDSRTERELFRALREVLRASTALVIAHRLSAVVEADEILVLENGRIAEQGNHHMLLRRNGRYAELWRAQQDGVAAFCEAT